MSNKDFVEIMNGVINCIRGLRVHMNSVQEMLNTTNAETGECIISAKIERDCERAAKQVEQFYHRMEAVCKTWPDRIEKLPIHNSVLVKTANLYQEEQGDVHKAKHMDDLLDIHYWLDGASQYFLFLHEFLRTTGTRRKGSVMEKRPLMLDMNSGEHSPHFYFNMALQQAQQELVAKKTGIWPTILEKTSFGSVVEVKYGVLVERQRVIQLKMLLVENTGTVEMVRFLAPHEEWTFMEDFGNKRLDLTKQSKYKVYQRLTAQANVSLQNLMIGIQTDHRWRTMQLVNLLQMFSRFSSIFDSPCKYCKKVMKDYLPCISIDPRNPRSVFHETCR